MIKYAVINTIISNKIAQPHTVICGIFSLFLEDRFKLVEIVLLNTNLVGFKHVCETGTHLLVLEIIRVYNILAAASYATLRNIQYEIKYICLCHYPIS